MTSITDAATRRALSKLKAAILAKDEPIAAATTKLAELRERQASLRQRIAAEEATATRRTDSLGAELADALAIDADADIDGEAVDALVQRQIADSHAEIARTARIKLLVVATGKLDAPIAANVRQIDQLERERDAQVIELKRDLHAALIEEFRRRWTVLSADVVEPLLALGLDPHVAGATTSHLECERPLALKTFVTGGRSRWNTEYLLRLDSSASSDRAVAAPDLVETLLAALPA